MNSKKILSAYERWELPVLNDSQIVAGLWNQSAQDEMPNLPTAEELESLRLKAQQEGFAEGKKQGYEQGYALGLSNGQEELQQVVTQFNHLMRAFVDPIAQQDEHLECVLLTLVQNICTQLLKRELMLNSQGILLVVREALDKIMSGQHRVKIYIHPQDHALLEKFLPQQSEYEAQWRILPRDTLTPGGCVIETDHHLIDATVQGRLQQWMDQLYQKKLPTTEGSEHFMTKHDLLTGQQGFA